MPRVHVGTENRTDIEIHCEDHGSGQPLVLAHGYPLTGNSREGGVRSPWETSRRGEGAPAAGV